MLNTCSKFSKITLYTVIFTWFLILVNGFGVLTGEVKVRLKVGVKVKVELKVKVKTKGP